MYDVCAPPLKEFQIYLLHLLHLLLLLKPTYSKND